MNIEKLKNEIINFSIGKSKLIYISKKMIVYNTKLSKSDNFINSQLFKNIVNLTNFLPINTIIQFRIKCIIKNQLYIPNCPICGKKCSINLSLKSKDSCFHKTCGNKSCMVKYATQNMPKKTLDQKNKIKNWMKDHKSKLIEIYKNFIQKYFKKDFVKINKSELILYFKNIYNSKRKNGSTIKEYQFKNEKDQIMLLNLLDNTKFINIEFNKSKSDFKFDERIYCLLNEINSPFKCKFCHNKNVKFINLKSGYSKSCNNCSDEKYRQKIGYPTLKEIQTYINTEKYEILNFPKSVTKEFLKIKCKKCGNIIQYKLFNGRGKNIKNKEWCNVCYPQNYISTPEVEILNFIKSIYNKEIKHSDRLIIKPLELDIYIPDKKLAIEFDGLYYHNDLIVKPGYHIFKTKLTEEKNIQLIHIFENEWLTKQNIVKSRIKNLLGIYDKVIFARKCYVKEVDSKISKEFLNKNHIQGSVNSKIDIGLYFKDQLVSLMTFGKSRFNKQYEWELLRFCTELGYHIPGAASKLLKYFERNYKPKSLISYADRRWSQGKLYKALGFIFKYNSKINYWYFNNYKKPTLLSRINFQKHKLKEKLKIFDPLKTEDENMKNNGYFRIFDCGNMVFEKKYGS